MLQLSKYIVVSAFFILGIVLPAASWAGAAGYKIMNGNESFVAETNGFVVVRLEATANDRLVVAHGLVDGEIVASGSAADNFVDQVFSSPIQSFTFPVGKDSEWGVHVDQGTGVEVRWFSYKAAVRSK